MLSLTGIPLVYVRRHRRVHHTTIMQGAGLTGTPHHLLAHSPILSTRHRRAFPLNKQNGIIRRMVISVINPRTTRLLIRRPIRVLHTFTQDVQRLNYRRGLITRTRTLGQHARADLITKVRVNHIRMIGPLLRHAKSSNINDLHVQTSQHAKGPRTTRPRHQSAITTFKIGTVLRNPSPPVRTLAEQGGPIASSGRVKVTVRGMSWHDEGQTIATPLWRRRGTQ